MLVYIKPLSLFPKLHSDTLFGAILYSISELYPNKVDELLDSFKKGEPPFVLTSTFPFIYSQDEKVRFYPKLILNNKKSNEVKNRDILKEFKKIEYFEEEIFFKLINGEISENEILNNFDSYYKSGNLLMGKEYSIDNSQKSNILPNNSVNRLTNETEGIFYSEGDNFMNRGLFFFVEFYNKEYEPVLKGAIKFLKDRGFGRDISTGKGQFVYEIEDVNLNDLAGNSDGGNFITLSRFIPINEDLKRINEYSSYEIDSKRGRSASGEIRKEVKFFKEGSTFPDYQKFYGKIVDSGKINPAVEYGFAFPLKYNINNLEE